MNINRINDRLDAVEDLMQYQFETDIFRAKASKLPDIERLLARMFTYSVKSKFKAVFFENVSLNKLKEFRALLKTFKALP